MTNSVMKSTDNSEYSNPMKRIIILFFSLLIILFPSAVYGREPEPNPVSSSITFGIGSSHLADTYLTPLKYSGWSTSVRYERRQSFRPSPSKWETMLNVEGILDRTLNPARNTSMWSFQAMASWGVARYWSFPKGITAGIGPSARLEGGCLYNSRNSNNPASAKAAFTIDATAYASWTTHIRNTPVIIRYQPTMPIIGAFFSPTYDELYFEIYMGNHHGLVHPAWWGNRFKLDNLFTIDIGLGSSWLRIGYESSWMSSKVSGLTTRMISHRFIIGWTTTWFSIKPKKSKTTIY